MKRLTMRFERMEGDHHQAPPGCNSSKAWAALFQLAEFLIDMNPVELEKLRVAASCPGSRVRTARVRGPRTDLL